RLVISPDRTVAVEVSMRGGDVDRAVGTRIFDEASGLVQPPALAATAAQIIAYVEAHTSVLGEDGRSCRPGAGHAAADGDGVVVGITWRCAEIGDPLHYRSTALIDVSPDARQIVLIGAGPDAAQDLLDASHTETALTEAAPAALLQVIGRYTRAGIE